ncbi:hypothetical protein [Edaphobacter sp. 12200R-103]|jgi:hypothetical protein|uniref:hypothetical protein n=1 Tax=Edaphobacter sp. 12200R-103 TaxID=2703788 RepID=UPI00138C82F5|nr:hypothetical protein [Edaphobacter sp. 12200R-103]QHS51434.1 hypothetical protein GWR55_06510 [Edaphobacter sp. 12200R-103]
MTFSNQARIVELHKQAAHAHMTAAASHDKSDHLTAHELSQKAHELSMEALRLAKEQAKQARES